MQQKNELQCSFRPLSVLFFHLLLSHSCSGQSQLIAPSQRIVATVGDDIILPCHLVPEADVVAMTFEWTRSDLNPIFVHVRRASQDVIRIQHPSFRGRTSVSIDELKHGNVSLKLSKVKPSDAGRYQCYIPKLNTGSVVELIVVLPAGEDDTSQKHQDVTVPPDKPNSGTDGLTKIQKVVIGVPAALILIVIITLVYCCHKHRKQRYNPPIYQGVPVQPLQTHQYRGKINLGIIT